MSSFIVFFMIIMCYIIIIPIIKIVLSKKIIILANNRLMEIDGLRGFLSTGVFFHHYVVNYFWHTQGRWASPPFIWVNNIGQISVALFFIITGYLFFQKIIKNKYETKSFLINRFFRIAPLYYFVIFFMFLIIFYMTNLKFENITLELINEILKWIFFLQNKVNAFSDTYHVTASVTWTLRYEWIFYLSLPILFYLYRKQIIFFYFILFLILLIGFNEVVINIFNLFSINSIFLLLFLMGFFIAKYEIHLRNSDINFNGIYFNILNLLLILFVIFYFETGYGIPQFIILGIFFMLIVLKNSLFGVLTWQYSRILGEISYSIYLLHGLILYTTFSIIFDDFIKIHEYYVYAMPVMMIIIMFAMLTYILIEYPGMQFGKRISKKVIR